MATYASNDAFLSIDGTSIAAYFKEISFEATMDTIDVTAGTGTANRERAVGLKDHSATLTIVYDDAQHGTLLPLVAPGSHAIIYGPQGNANGEPKHVQTFIITGVSHGVKVEKDLVLLEASMEAAGAPTTDMFNSGVWP